MNTPPPPALSALRIEVRDPHDVPSVFSPRLWRVLQDGATTTTVLLNPRGAWTQLPRGVADQLLDRLPGGKGQPPRGLVYLLAQITDAGWTGPFEIRAEPGPLADTVTWSADRVSLGVDGAPSRVRVPK